MVTKEIFRVLPRSWQHRLRKVVTPEGDCRGVVDLRGVTADPIEAYYAAHRRSPVVEIPTAVIRTFQCVGLPLDEKIHPFIATVNSIRKAKHTSYEGSPLHAYHTNFQPADAFAVLGIEPCERMLRRGFGSPFAAVLPWWPDVAGIRPEDRHASIAQNAIAECRAAGITLPENPTLYYFGPFSTALGELEYMRLKGLAAKVHNDGFQRSDAPDGDIKGIALINSERETRILLNGGEHRAAVAAALGLSSIPVRLFSTISNVLVRRDDVEFWPHVRSGLFSRDQALSVFDRIFAGTPPPAMASER